MVNKLHFHVVWLITCTGNTQDPAVAKSVVRKTDGRSTW
jgi:hypothetical protein